MPMISRSKSELKLEFQNGGRSFSQTRSSNSSALGWDAFAKFGTLRDTGLLRTTALSNWNRKLIRDVNGRHLENFNDVINTPPMVRFIGRCKMRCRSPLARWKVETRSRISYGGCSFSQAGSSYNSAVDWVICTKFGTLRDPDLLRTWVLPN